MLVQDLAEELNITRSEIYNILRKKRFAPLVKKNGSQIIIDKELSELLKEELEKKKQLTPKKFKKKIQNYTIRLLLLMKIFYTKIL